MVRLLEEHELVSISIDAVMNIVVIISIQAVLHISNIISFDHSNHKQIRLLSLFLESDFQTGFLRSSGRKRVRRRQARAGKGNSK